MLRLNYRIYIFIVGIVISTIALPAYALELQYPHVPGFGADNETLNTFFNAGNLSFGQLVQFVFATSLWIAGLMAFGALVVAGFLYATSQGAPMKRMLAKNRIQSVAIGTGILLGLYIILGLVNPQLLTLGGGSFKICGGANTPPCEYPEFPNVNKGGASAPIGPTTPCRGTRTTTFQSVYSMSVNAAAEIICSNNTSGSLPTENSINTFLKGQVGVDICTQADVSAVETALTSAPSCAGLTTAGGTSGGITITPSTRPANFCIYNESNSSILGPVFNQSTIPTVQITFAIGVSRVTDEAIQLIRDNIGSIIRYCATSTAPICKLQNPSQTNISTLDESQKELLVQVCANELRRAEAP